MNVSVEDVKKAYGLKGVSFSVDKGSLVAVVGINGAGKTTLLRTMAGLNALNTGQIVYDGELFSRRRVDLRKRIFFAPDQPPMLNDRTVAKFIGIVLAAFVVDATRLEKRVVDILDEFDLSSKVHLPMRQLSRGQRYKVMLTTMFAANADLWLVDEPFASGMDALGMDVFRRYVRQACAIKKTVLYTTQILEIAESFSDQICVLDKGKVAAMNTIAELRASSDKVGLLEILRDLGH